MKYANDVGGDYPGQLYPEAQQAEYTNQDVYTVSDGGVLHLSHALSKQEYFYPPGAWIYLNADRQHKPGEQLKPS